MDRLKDWIVRINKFDHTVAMQYVIEAECPEDALQCAVTSFFGPERIAILRLFRDLWFLPASGYDISVSED